jgi:general stress protein YciG
VGIRALRQDDAAAGRFLTASLDCALPLELVLPGVGNFADLPADRRQELGRRGGKRAHASGSAHKWTREEASAAGRKSGQMRKKSDMKKKSKRGGR